jgi:hypothetical protein
MLIENSTIVFRSHPENYKPEESGLKQNTLKYIHKSDLELCKVKNGILYVDGIKITNIKIINSHTSESFTRTLTNVSCLNEYFTFSWNTTINAAFLYNLSYCQQIKLDANSHKTPINEIKIPYIMSRLLEEVKELDDEVFSNAVDPIKVCDEAVDVANFALFIFSKFFTSTEEYQAYIDSRYAQIRAKTE